MRKHLKYLVISVNLVFLLIGANSYAQINLQKVRFNDFTGGMVSNSLAELLEPNQGASMINVALEQRGKVKKREGQGLFNVDTDHPNTGITPLRGIGRFDPDATTSYLVIASGTNVARSTSTATGWTLASDTAVTTTGKNTEFVQANNLFFVLNGFDSTGFYDGSTYYTSSAYPTSPPSATTGAWLRNYLFLAGATNNTDWLYFSNNLDPKVFDATDIIKINTGDGQKIQKVLPYRLNELIIYKTRSIFVLDITGSTPITDWTVQPISKVVGTIAPRSVVSLGNDQWFLSSEPIAIRSLIRTEFDKILVNTVSLPIQDIFDRTNDFDFNLNINQVEKACAILFDNKYILAIPTGTSTTNNTVLVHDFRWGAWYIIKGWNPSAWLEFDNRLFYTDAQDGSVIEVFTGTTGDFPVGTKWINSASDPSVGIEWVVVSKGISFDNEENYKQSDSLEVQFDPTGDFDVNAFINLDNKGWNNLGTVNLAGQSLTLPVTLPTVLSNSGIARETFQTQQYNEFRTMQFMLSNLASQETVTLERVTVFGDLKKWRRE